MDILVYQKKILAWPSLKIGHMYMRVCPLFAETEMNQRFGKILATPSHFKSLQTNTCNTCVDRRLCIYNNTCGGFAYNNTHARDRDKLFAHAHNTWASHNIYAHTRVQDDRNQSHTKHKTNKVTDTARPRVLDEEKSWDWVGYWARKLHPYLPIKKIKFTNLIWVI